MNMNERERAVLAAIIEEYINTGEPVPSSRVCEKSRLGLSPASIRSVMVKLTDQGYLAQPHVSSGRIPEAKAFRLYIDTVLSPQPLSIAQKNALTTALDVAHPDISQILRKASSIVSARCMQLGVVLAPRRDEMRWRAIEFSPVGANLVLAVLILDGGLVRNRLVAVTTKYSSEQLTRFSNYLNEHFKGCAISEARELLQTELEQAGEELEEMCRNALALSRPALEDENDAREIFMDGIARVSRSSRFADTARLRELLLFMEEKPKILDLLERTMNSRDISVSFIHGEFDTPWAVVSAPYAREKGDAPLGVVSAVGLWHMNYATVLPVVAHIASSVAAVMRSRLENR